MSGRALLSGILWIETALGVEKLLEASRDGAVIVCISAFVARVLIVVTSELVGLVFTALMKIFLLSAVRVTVTSR